MGADKPTALMYSLTSLGNTPRCKGWRGRVQGQTGTPGFTEIPRSSCSSKGQSPLYSLPTAKDTDAERT